MRSFQLLTLALLATAARAAQIGIFNVSSIPPNSSVALSADGLSLGGTWEFDSPYGFLSVSVPEGLAVGASFIAYEVATIPAEGFDTGVIGAMYGHDGNGNRVTGELDLGDYGVYPGPCTECGFSSEYGVPIFYAGIPIRTITIEGSVQIGM